jgi:hypothetical protein
VIFIPTPLAASKASYSMTYEAPATASFSFRKAIASSIYKTLDHLFFITRSTND